VGRKERVTRKIVSLSECRAALGSGGVMVSYKQSALITAAGNSLKPRENKMLASPA